jgi:hypothetical protein
VTARRPGGQSGAASDLAGQPPRGGACGCRGREGSARAGRPGPDQGGEVGAGRGRGGEERRSLPGRLLVLVSYWPSSCLLPRRRHGPPGKEAGALVRGAASGGGPPAAAAFAIMWRCVGPTRAEDLGLGAHVDHTEARTDAVSTALRGTPPATSPTFATPSSVRTSSGDGGREKPRASSCSGARLWQRGWRATWSREGRPTAGGPPRRSSAVPPANPVAARCSPPR